MKQIKVAVGVIKNADNELLISLRHDHLHQGGLWEFSGGKIEPNETAEHALKRELKEELGIEVIHAKPLITINHQYSDRNVQLQVFLVTDYLGIACHGENQDIRWVHESELKQYQFPAANKPIITAARLPEHYAILDDAEPELLKQHLNTILSSGIKLIQARLKQLPKPDEFINYAYTLCQEHYAVFLLNSSVKSEIKTDGIHLTSRDLMALSKRPDNISWLAASCHNIEELKHAENIGVDFAVLAPVLATKTHPNIEPLGWQQFAELVAQCNIPVYALGGQNKDTLSIAQQTGARGIAAIRAFLN
ncbi:8-oxo-dGTP diphosphatase [Patescibacteria group bacterium]|nr:8-oxo-dGTP diphosphatase [Patescibacteria group bacterium]